MKGITPVIAIILLLLITISMVGFAFVWFTRLGEEATKAIDEQQNATIGNIAKKVRIDNAFGDAVTLRNIGTQTVEKSELGFFVDGQSQSCAAPAAPNDWTKIAPGEIKSCTLQSSCRPKTLRVTSPGGVDSVTCK